MTVGGRTSWRSGSGSCSRTRSPSGPAYRTVFEEVALGPMNLGLPADETVAGARGGPGYPRIEAWPSATRSPVGRAGAARRHRVAPGDAAAPPGPRRADRAARSGGDASGGRGAAGARRTGTRSSSRSTRPTCSTDLPTGSPSSPAGGSCSPGRRRDVLADPRLELGVEPPARVRLRARRSGGGLARPSCGGAGAWGACAVTARAIEGLGYVYPDGTRALDGVDLVIRPANGRDRRPERLRQVDAGAPLNGLLRPTAGRVLLGGATCAAGAWPRSPDGRPRFQDPDRQIFAGRVRAEVAFGPRTSVPGGAGGGRGGAGSSGSSEADTNPYDLGYSRRKLLALASILAMDTPVVVLDEPTTGQDLAASAGIRGHRGGLRPRAARWLPSATTCASWPRHSQRIIVMGAGHVLLDGTPRDVFAEPAWPTLASTYLEPPLAAPGRGAHGRRSHADRGRAHRQAGGAPALEHG